jgi:glucuronoarabinoxylan endo-1,4-beta-xylanase
MFNKMKKLLFGVMLWIIAVTLAFNGTAPIHAAGDITVNATATKQTIRGFGGMNHPVWISDLTESQRTTAFGNDEGQIGMSILRMHVDESSSNWSREVATAQRAIELGAIVFASPWNPPSNMTEVVNGKKRLKYDQYGAYTDHLNSFISYMKQSGVDLYAISIQNEPDYAHDWTWWSATEIVNYLKHNASSLQTRVMAPESFQYIKSMSDPILNDPQALANLDILGAHLYGTALSDFPYPLFTQKGQGKELWMTEVYTDSSNDADLWPTALDVAYNIHNSMVEAEFNAYVWWYIRRFYGMIKENGQVSKRGYCMAQFSKFIRPGYVRVDATKNPTGDVYVSAYKSDQNMVIVVVNRSASSKNLSLSINGATVQTLTKYTTSGSKNVKNDGTVSSSNGSFSLSFDAQSVTTFVGSLTGSTMTPEPTSTSTSTPSPRSAFNQIEAEAYDNQSGTQTETCSEGGENIGYIENEDYVVYNNIDFGNGAVSFQAEVASAADGGNIEIRLDSITGTLVGTCSVTGTGDWQTWITATCNVSGASGTHDLYLKFTGESGYLFNLNWFKFTGGSATSTSTSTSTLTPTPTPTGTVTPTSTVTPSQTQTQTQTPTASPNTTDYSISYSQSDWGSGATVSVTIKNNSAAALNGWTLAWNFAGNQTITNIWNATYTQSGTAVTVKNASYNSAIPAKGSVSFGFNIAYSGVNAKPTDFTLNGTACQIQ